MRKKFALLLFMTLCFLTPAHASLPPAGHQELSRNLIRATEQADLLRSEVQKGPATNREALRQDLQSIRGTLQALKASEAQIAQDVPGDLRDEHYVASQDHRNMAETYLEGLETENAKAKPDPAKLSQFADNVLFELRFAKNEHDFQMSEIKRGSEW